MPADNVGIGAGRYMEAERSEQAAEGPGHAFPSGAKSSVKMPDYSKCPKEAIQAITRRFDLGEAAGYTWEWNDEGLRGNYERGLNDPEFVRDRFNHAVDHLLKFKVPGGTLADLDGAICNLAMLCWFAKHGTGLAKAFPHLAQEQEAGVA